MTVDAEPGPAAGSRLDLPHGVPDFGEDGLDQRYLGTSIRRPRYPLGARYDDAAPSTLVITGAFPVLLVLQLATVVLVARKHERKVTRAALLGAAAAVVTLPVLVARPTALTASVVTQIALAVTAAALLHSVVRSRPGLRDAGGRRGRSRARRPAASTLEGCATDPSPQPPVADPPPRTAGG